MDDYMYTTCGDVVKFFLKLWLVLFCLLVAASLVKHWDAILSIMGGSLMSLFTGAFVGLLPVILILYMLFQLVKLPFK